MRELLNGVIKKFEVFESFYTYDKNTIDFKTRIDEYELEDITYLHALHRHLNTNWGYESPIFEVLERKKRLRVSRNGEGRMEMQTILREAVEEAKEKSPFEKLAGG